MCESAHLKERGVGKWHFRPTSSAACLSAHGPVALYRRAHEVPGGQEGPTQMTCPDPEPSLVSSLDPVPGALTGFA